MGSDIESLILEQDDSPVDKLFGIIAQFAFLQRNLESVAGLDGLHRDRACEALLQRCSKLQETLHTDWLSGAAEAFEGEPQPFSEDGPPPDQTLLPLDAALAPYTFRSLNSAKTYLLFWVASLKISQLICRVEKLLRRNSNPTHMLFYAGEICRSMAYCMQPKIRLSADHASLFAISQASKCYIACGAIDQFTWCQGIYRFINRQGFDVASCVGDADWALWFAAQSQIIASEF
ncbi:hypothetical protein N7451_005867 [Penicillium sp. IBT 35674x]|nr:hypothetical protein N7451_005867 [Penicillium sp. IBT 35674x]